MYLNLEKFNSTYCENFNKLLNYLKSKCQNSFEAEDIAQESFVKLWQHREKIESGKETSFLYTIAYNLFIDKKRRDSVRYRFQQHARCEVNYETPEFKILSTEFDHYVQQKIQEMPKASREVFIMNKIEKRTYSEIADIIGLSIKSVEKRMSVALKTYRELRKVC
ncbi:MAG: RNA polymerase sigma factor [Saprospiraceae bacterium]|nr:RNA polymerase sigma factor [Saprospiraceae bacterium]